MRKYLFSFILICLSLSSCSSSGGHHRYSDKWSFDEQSHWHACLDAGCEDLKKDVGSHTFEETITPPTYEHSGYTTHVCDICGYSYKDSIVDKLKSTVLFDLNGGSTNSDSSPQYVDYFSEIDFFFDCTKTGYNFRGWSYLNNKVINEKGLVISTPEMCETMSFVAIFTKTAILTIITNIPNSGVITGSGEYSFNSSVDVSAKPNQGYVFDGWYYQGNLLSTTEDYNYMMWDQDIELEARFSYDSFEIDIKSNKPEHGLVLLKSAVNTDYLPEYSGNREYTSFVEVAAFSKTSVRFLGWYDIDNCLVSTNAVFSFQMPNYNYFLEAKWNYFDITYNLFGGTNNPSNPITYCVEDGSILLNNPTRSNYEFLGWKFNGQFVSSIDSSWSRDVVLDAVWKATTYSVVYYLDGGVNNPDNPLVYTIESPDITLLSPSKIGFTFLGWYDSDTFENQVSCIHNGSFGDLNLYAKWEYSIYLITYVTYGGVFDESVTTNYRIIDSITLPFPLKENMVFEGWYLNSDFTGNKINRIEGFYEDIILYANWVEPTPLDNIQIRIDSFGLFIVGLVSNSLRQIVIRSKYTIDGISYNLVGITLENNYILQKVVIEKGTADFIYFSFRYCKALKEIIIPNSVNHFESCAFEGCISLESIAIPESITLIEWNTFLGCTSITSIVLPDGVTSIDESAFRDCTSLSSVTIPNSVVSIKDSAFSGCYSLSNVLLPESVRIIESYAFHNCPISSINLPENIEIIGNCAFVNYVCHPEIVILPDSIIFISGLPFSRSTKVFYKNSKEYWDQNVITENVQNIIYFYSENAPLMSDNYWHYVNGVPTIW